MGLMQRAQAKANWALRSGKLQREAKCQKCGTDDPRLHMHHPNYFEPLTVEWMCTQCHINWHVDNGPAIGADLSSLADRIERWGIRDIYKYPRSFVNELHRQILAAGKYIGPDGVPIRASRKLRKILEIRQPDIRKSIKDLAL